jgi:hypothetical protein
MNACTLHHSANQQHLSHNNGSRPYSRISAHHRKSRPSPPNQARLLLCPVALSKAMDDEPEAPRSARSRRNERSGRGRLDISSVLTTNSERCVRRSKIRLQPTIKKRRLWVPKPHLRTRPNQVCDSPRLRPKRLWQQHHSNSHCPVLVFLGPLQLPPKSRMLTLQMRCLLLHPRRACFQRRKQPKRLSVSLANLPNQQARMH